MTEPLDLDAREKELREWHAGKEMRVRPGSDIGLLLLRLDEVRAAVRERDTEIARLRELFRIDGEQHGNALREARHEQDARIAAYSAEIARLSATPGADAMERSSRVWYTEIDGKPQSPGWTITTYARALQQYGDERAREATEAERRHCATIDHNAAEVMRA